MTDKNLPSSPASVPPVPPASPSLDRRFPIFLGPLVLTNILQAWSTTSMWGGCWARARWPTWGC